MKVASFFMLLKGVVRLKKGEGSRYLKMTSPWIYSNELLKFDKTISPGSWVALESENGTILGYGFFNPNSLIAYREFDRKPFESEDQTRAFFYKKLDCALQFRQRVYAKEFQSQQMGLRSFRLAFGESDGLPGLIIDLFEGGSRDVAVIQCHSAGSDQLIIWTQQWLEERLGIDRGIIKNDLEVRKRENVKLEILEWGDIPDEVYAIEGGVRFLVPLKKGQKTGYFYDHRDNRAMLANLTSTIEQPFKVLDCFSYLGSWGLQVLKRNNHAKLVAVDVSKFALDLLIENALLNGLKDRVEVLECDVFKQKEKLFDASRRHEKFDIVISDPPSMSASAKQSGQSFRAHQECYKIAYQCLKKDGMGVFASCSFHLNQEDFLETLPIEKMRVFQLGSQSMDHPVSRSLPESRYLKCAFVEKNGE